MEDMNRRQSLSTIGKIVGGAIAYGIGVISSKTAYSGTATPFQDLQQKLQNSAEEAGKKFEEAVKPLPNPSKQFIRTLDRLAYSPEGKEFIEKLIGRRYPTLDELFEFDNDCNCYTIDKKIGGKTLSVLIERNSGSLQLGRNPIALDQPLYLFISDKNGEVQEVLSDTKLEGNADGYFKATSEASTPKSLYSKLRLHMDTSKELKSVNVKTLPQDGRTEIQEMFEHYLKELIDYVVRRRVDYMGTPPQIQNPFAPKN